MRQVQKAALDSIRTGADCHITFRLKRPTGEVRWVRIRARRSEVLGPGVVIGVTIDVTDRMLVETDAPYLAPVPFRGKVNEPAYVVHTARFIAALRSIPEGELAEAVRQNFDFLFGA